MKSHPTILILAGHDHPQIIEGIVAWSREKGPWDLRHVASVESNRQSRPRPAGILADSDNKLRPSLEAYMAMGIPAVLFSESPHDQPARVVPDNRAVGALAVEHFVELGLGHVAFAGQPGLMIHDQRRQGFLDAADQAGVDVHDFDRNAWAGVDYFAEEYQRLLGWLRELPKPAGLLCVFPGLAHRMLHFIVEHGLSVPDDIAVLSAEREDSRRYMCVPPLSMVDLGEFRLGYEAAELLHHKMAGRDGRTHRIVIPPAGLIPRGSTDVLAVDSPRLAEAIRFIRENALKGIQVGDVAEACRISRRGLEIAMRRNFGQTVQEELTRIRVAEARRLLSSTSLPVADIGPRCGFEWGTTLHAVFKRHTGMTPKQYRTYCRGRQEPGPE